MIQRLTALAGLRRRQSSVRSKPMPFAWQNRAAFQSLVAKLRYPSTRLLVHFHVAALAFHRRHEEAQRIGAVLVDQAERIDHVAF